MKINLYDWDIYGEYESQDCPQGDACKCKDKAGFLTSQAIELGKDLYPTSASAHPIYKIKKQASYHTDIDIYNMRFHNFDSEFTLCGARQHGIKVHKYSSDYTALHRFHNTLLDNVNDNSFAFIMDPNPGWAGVTDCGEWPCTAPSNIVFNFKNT